MTELDSRASSTANVVEGFSARFNVLLDRAGLPKAGRAAAVAKRFSIVLNTAKHWCADDRIPQSHADLARIVQNLLKDVPTRADPKAVIAWLIAGDAVPHPFGDDGNALRIVELYLEIAEFSKQRGIDFNRMPRDVRQVILGTVSARVGAGSGHDGKARLDLTTREVLAGMLETGRALNRSG